MVLQFSPTTSSLTLALFPSLTPGSRGPVGRGLGEIWAECLTVNGVYERPHFLDAERHRSAQQNPAHGRDSRQDGKQAGCRSPVAANKQAQRETRIQSECRKKTGTCTRPATFPRVRMLLMKQREQRDGGWAERRIVSESHCLFFFSSRVFSPLWLPGHLHSMPFSSLNWKKKQKNVLHQGSVTSVLHCLVQPKCQILSLRYQKQRGNNKYKSI